MNRFSPIFLGQVPLRSASWMAQAQVLDRIVLSEHDLMTLDFAFGYLATRDGMRYVNCPQLVSESYPGPRAMIFPDPVWIAVQNKVQAALSAGGNGTPRSLALEGNEAVVARVVLDCYAKDQAERAPVVEQEVPATIVGIPTTAVAVGAGVLLLVALLT